MLYHTSAMLRAAVSILSLLAAARRADATYTTSPNHAIAKPGCDVNTTVSLRYSATSKRLYVESADGATRGGCVTLKKIWTELGGAAPLFAVNATTGGLSDVVTGTWLLTETLYVKHGITLQVHGASAGGDSDELRLLSTSERYINLRAYGGSLDFVSTKVFGWDASKNAPDENRDARRSYISAISEVITDRNQTCSGSAKNEMGEARMDIEDSEMAYLGYHDGESYGLTWKVMGDRVHGLFSVRGYCTDGRNPEVFDMVNVYGNIYGSDIHHNHFGVYTYGHQQGDWRNNKMHDNTAYGFDPHDDSDFLTIHDNKVYNNGNHGIIASKRCNGVSIQGNEVYGGSAKSVGIFLHRSSDDAIVKGNYVHDNGDSGMALMEVFDAVVSDNIFESNKYGVRLSVGSADNIVFDNLINDSIKYNVFTYEGTDAPWVVGSGRPQDNVFWNNTIIGARESIKLTVADGTRFINNTFEGIKVLRFEDSMETVMLGNTGLEGVELKVNDGSCFNRTSDAVYGPVCYDGIIGPP